MSENVKGSCTKCHRVINRLQIVMHLKGVKYACKYALKASKYALKTPKTPTTNIKIVKNKTIFLQKVKLF